MLSVINHPDGAHDDSWIVGELCAKHAANPNNHQTRRWMGEKIMAFLDEQGMRTWNARPIYRLVQLS